MINLIFFLLFISSAVNAEKFQIVTTDFAPYQTLNKDKIEGLITEIVKEVLLRSGDSGEIKMYPWARAYKLAQREPDTLIYSIARTPEREKLFKWIGVVAPYNVYFWKLSNRPDVKVASMEDAKKYISGGVFNDVKAEYLIKSGFVQGKNIEYVSSDFLNIKKIFAGRIDLLMYDELSLPYKVQDTGYDFKKLVKVVKLDGVSQDLYLAASLQTSDEKVKKLTVALEDFKKTKKYKEIKNRIK